MLDKSNPRSLGSLAVANVSCVLMSLNVCFPTCSPFPLFSPCPSAAALICPDPYAPCAYLPKEMKCFTYRWKLHFEASYLTGHPSDNWCWCRSSLFWWLKAHIPSLVPLEGPYSPYSPYIHPHSPPSSILHAALQASWCSFLTEKCNNSFKCFACMPYNYF